MRLTSECISVEKEYERGAEKKKERRKLMGIVY